MVRYTLTESDAREIRSKRLVAGSASRSGNDAHEGDTYPAMIVRDWMTQSLEEVTAATRKLWLDPDSGWGLDKLFSLSLDPDSPADLEQIERHIADAARELHGQQVANATQNLQVFLDGNDTHWVTSRSEFDPAKHGRWVHHVRGEDHALPPEMQSAYSQNGTPDDSEDIQFRPDPKGHWSGEPVPW